jgi:hypothetical protein
MMVAHRIRARIVFFSKHLLNESALPYVGCFSGWPMAKQDRAELYLAKAKQAEEQAQRTTDPLAKSTWERIAKGYRDLARMPGLW